jgi:hypothetical protein
MNLAPDKGFGEAAETIVERMNSGKASTSRHCLMIIELSPLEVFCRPCYGQVSGPGTDPWL